MTSLWHISSHYSKSSCCCLKMSSHLTETNCCCSCLVIPQWLVSSKSATETRLPMHQMYFHFIQRDILGPICMSLQWRGSHIRLCIYLQNSLPLLQLLSQLSDVNKRHFYFYSQLWNVLKLMLLKFCGILLVTILIMNTIIFFLKASVIITE